ncbi:MAG TPA: GAF domain-containing protein [Anaerolineae bacterium]|nr:GAF domain-containing protein [Anaerolineae bacterium]
MLWGINTLIPLLALTSYSALTLAVSLSKPHTQDKYAFRWYLLAMAVWSLSALMVRWREREVYFWFKMMTVSAIASMPGIFYFVQVLLPNKARWDKWVYMYSVVVVIFTLFTNLVITDAYIRDGELCYSFSPVIALVAVPGYLMTIFSIFSLRQGYLEARDARQRNRYRYLILGLVLIVLGLAFNFTELGQYPIDVAANLLTALVITYAILRHQLLDINVVIRRSMLYAFPTIVLGTAYFLIISLALNFFHATTGVQLLSVSLIVAVVAGLVVRPFHDWAQAWIDKIFFRERYDSQQMLQRLSQTTSSEIDLNKLTHMIMDEVTRTLHIERAAFFMKQDKKGEYALVAKQGIDIPKKMAFRSDHPLVNRVMNEQGVLTWSEIETMRWLKSLWKKEIAELEAIGAELFLPLRAKGDLVGIFILGPKLSDQPYTQPEQMILMTLSNQAAVAIQNAQLFSIAQKELEERRGAERSLKMQLKRLSALQSINIAITTNIDMQIPLLMLLEQVIDELKADAADVLLLDEETQVLAYVAGRGFYTDALKFTRLKPGKGLAGQAAKKMSVLYIKQRPGKRSDIAERIPTAAGGTVCCILWCSAGCERPGKGSAGNISPFSFAARSGMDGLP